MSSRVEIDVAATPEEVFAVLADAGSYANWVVGSSEIHESDDDWPEPGTLFEHTQGYWPLRVRDSTQVLESEPPRRLVLETRVRPFMVGEVEFSVRPKGRGSRVTMVERVSGGLARLSIGPGRDLLLSLRNRETLRRLRRLAEERAGYD